MPDRNIGGDMDRRDFLVATAVASLSAAQTEAVHADTPAAGPVESPELSLNDIAAGFKNGKQSSQQLTQMYLDRIDRLDRRGPMLGAVIQVNPRAIEIAAQLDAEYKAKGPRGPLHGVPVLLKDNVETSDHMATTAGSLALEGWFAPKDAPLAERLRAAGAVILGKTNLSEWANFRSTHSSSGWSGRGGQARNPYSLDRTPSGSSSGSAVAVSANLCAVAVGTETDGSIVSPASINGIVGIKPTVGLVSRRGIAPISHSQDTAGPLSRSVRDAALMLTVLSSLDTEDAASAAAAKHFGKDYAAYCNADGLRGARLGIARKFFADSAPLNAYLDQCIATLKSAGAVIVDPADLPLHGSFGAAELTVLQYEFKADLDAYLSRLPPTAPVRSLSALISFNEAHKDREMPIFDQELLHQSAARGPLTDKAYLQARAVCLNATRTKGIDAVLAEHKLDAMVTLTAGPAWLIDSINGDSDSGGCSSPAAIAGYPHITVPSGLHRGLPIGLSFFAGAFSEPTLIKLASGFESVARGRTPPRFLPSVSA
jgi:amidase